jgi:hypothetical protein
MKTKMCSVTGIEMPITEFYNNQSHSKKIDNFRRVTGVPVLRLKKLFNSLNPQTNG